MKLLENKVNIITPNADYPFGAIQDDNGTGNGTPVDTELLGDYTQFFSKLFDESGITANGLPDNETNGFQLYEALVLLTGIDKRLHDNWDMNANPSFAIAHGLPDHFKIRKVDVMVKSNTGAVFAPLLADGGVSTIDDTVINLTRKSGGGFDNVNFNNATIYVTVNYVL